MAVYAIGQIKDVKDVDMWMEYKTRVKDSLDQFGAKVLFRGKKIDSLIRDSDFCEMVVIEFDSKEISKEWFNSDSYQELASTREKGADVTLELYE